MERSIGFYWVESYPYQVEPAYWNGQYWFLVGCTYELKDFNMLYIGDKIEIPTGHFIGV